MTLICKICYAINRITTMDDWEKKTKDQEKGVKDGARLRKMKKEEGERGDKKKKNPLKALKQQ